MNPQQKFLGLLGSLLTLAVLGNGTASGQPAKVGRPSVLAVWDTGKPSAQPLSVQTLDVKGGWKALTGDVATHAFDGDAVIGNGRILAVARKQGTGVEVYTLGSGIPVWRARLLPVDGKGNERITLAGNSNTTVGLEVASKAGTVQFRLRKGELFVETEALSAGQTLRVECPGRFAVLPDFFADDILFDARKVPVDKVELPSENFVLHFTGKQDAIVMGVFENRDQDVRVTLSGQGAKRAITGSEIDFGKKGSKIWVAVLEGPGMWHAVEVSPSMRTRSCR